MGMVSDIRNSLAQLRMSNPTGVAAAAAFALMGTVKQTLDNMTDEERIVFAETLYLGARAARLSERKRQGITD